MDAVTFALLIPALGAIALVVWGVRHGRRRVAALAFDESIYPGLKKLRDAGVASRWLGLVVGGVLCLVVIPLGYLGRFALTGPSVGAIAAIAVIQVGQRLQHGAARTPGLAGIERRSARDYVSRARLKGLLIALGALAASAMFTTIAASPDDQGRAGRGLSTACSTTVWSAGVTSEEVETMGSSPFPGSFYTGPMVIALVALLAVGAGALVLIARRPRNGSDPELVRVDDALRRIAAEGVAATTGLGVGLTLLAVASSSYIQFGKAACVPMNIAASYTLALVALGALIYVLRSFVVVAVPGNGEPS